MGTFTINQIQVGKNLYLYPNDDGCNIDLTPEGDAKNCECVDDLRLNPDEDSTYVYSSATDLNYDLYELPDHTTETGTINYVQIYARAKSHSYPQSPDGVYKIILTDNACSNIYKSNDINLLADTYATYNKVWTTNPRTTAAWTWSDIDNLEIGVECSSPTITGISKTLTIRPNAAGTHTQLDKSGCTSNYECVDETVADDATTQVYRTSGGGVKYDVYNLEDHTTETGTITKIVVFAKMKYDLPGAGTDFAKIRIRTGGLNYTSSAFTVAHDWTLYSKTWTTNPNTAVAWTWADIDALQAGIQFDDFAHAIRCTQVYVVVYYTEAGINPQIRTTQCYAKINYDEEITCTLNKPKQISVDHQQNIKMLNFWSGNRAVYGLTRSKRTMVLTGTQYGNDACTKIECVKNMGEAGNEITTADLGSSEFDSVFRIISFGWKKISDQPLRMDWILELEYA